ncbi:MAG: thiosulfate oxidation carrier complex protein SoxZ [Hyphomicrobiaceae bacterium]
MSSRAILRVNPTARSGEILSVRTLIQHKMESGFRYTTTGERVPRDIITSFVATWDGEEIWRADLSSAIAANPFVAFTTVATKTGVLRVVWRGDNGFEHAEETRITVT